MVDEFVTARRSDPDQPPVVFVYQGTPEQGASFFGDDPSVVAVADPTGSLFAGAGVTRGGLQQMFGLRSWRAGVRATLQGHRIGRKVGDPWTMPTVLAVHDGTVVAEHVGEHAGDHPDVAALPHLLRTLEGAG